MKFLLFFTKFVKIEFTSLIAWIISSNNNHLSQFTIPHCIVCEISFEITLTTGPTSSSL